MIIRFLSRVLAAAGVAAGASQAWGQVQSGDPNVPTVDPTSLNPSWVPWIVAGLFAVGIFFVAFKNAKRTHLD